MRVHRIEGDVCKECEVRKLDPRFGEFFAYVERNRRDDESLIDAMKRIVYDMAFEAVGEKADPVGKLLSQPPNTVYTIIARRKQEREAERFAAERKATA